MKNHLVLSLLALLILATSCSESKIESGENQIVSDSVEDLSHWAKVDSANSGRVFQKFDTLRHFLVHDTNAEHLVDGDTMYSFIVDTNYAPYRGTLILIEKRYPDCRAENTEIETREYLTCDPQIGGQSSGWDCHDSTVVWVEKQKVPAHIESVLNNLLKVINRRIDTVTTHGVWLFVSPPTKKA